MQRGGEAHRKYCYKAAITDSNVSNDLRNVQLKKFIEGIPPSEGAFSTRACTFRNTEIG
jgi:hypothetical protein